MRVVHYQQRVLKHWWFLALCVALAGLGAVVNLVVVPTTYAARTRLLLDLPATSLVASQQYILTQINAATSTVVLENAAAKLPGVTLATLRKEVSADAISGTDMFEIVVLDTNQSRGALIANTVALELILDSHDSVTRMNVAAQAMMQTNIDNAQHDLNAAKATLQSLRDNNATPQQILAASATVDELDTRYINTVQGMVDLQLNQALYLYALRIVTPATASQAAAQPPRTLVIGLALSLGLLAGIIGLLLSDIFNEQFRLIKDPTDVVPWEVLGRVKAQSATSGLAAAMPVDREGFASTLMSLRFLDLASSARRIGVVSVGRPDATSEVAAGLALAGATSGQRTLLMDAAFPGGSQAQRFGVSPQPGLTEALLDAREHGDAAAPGQYMQSPVTVAVSDLRLLTTGAAPAVAPSVAGAPALREQVYSLAQRSGANLVIVDLSTPGRLTEMAQLAAGADAVVVVVDLSVARRADVTRAANALIAAQAPVVGCIVAQPTPVAAPVHAQSPDHSRKLARSVTP